MEKEFNLKSIEGKKIKKSWIEGIKNYDDKPFLFIEFTDGTIIKIVADYGGYTGKSEDEYIRYISIENGKRN